MDDINKVILSGRLTRDPSITTFEGGGKVVDFGLAMNRKFKDKEGGKREEACFIDCRAFGKRAEAIHKYFIKGKPILLEGRLRISTWDDVDGKKRSKIRVETEKFYFLDSVIGTEKEEIVDLENNESTDFDIMET